MSEANQFKQALSSGAIKTANEMLQSNPELANNRIVWGPDNKISTDPLHYISDCVFNESLSDDAAAELASLLIDHGALINGSEHSESPLIGAASLYAIKVADVLIEKGADIHRVSVFDSTALHWAAYIGTPTVVKSLLDKGADLELKCSEFGSTPLFWAVQGFSQYGPARKTDQLAAAETLIAHGADVCTMNNEGVTAIERSRQSESDAMTRLLETHIGLN